MGVVWIIKNEREAVALFLFSSRAKGMCRLIIMVPCRQTASFQCRYDVVCLRGYINGTGSKQNVLLKNLESLASSANDPNMKSAKFLFPVMPASGYA